VPTTSRKLEVKSKKSEVAYVSLHDKRPVASNF